MMENNPFLKDAHSVVLYGNPEPAGLKLMEAFFFFINRKRLFSFFDQFGSAKRSTGLGGLSA